MSETCSPTPALRRHHLPVADLEAVAEGRPTSATLTRITAAERSRRMLLLRGVSEAEQQRRADAAGPLPPVSVAMDLLARAERTHPGTVTDLLGHPGTGLWASRTLRRLRAGAASPVPSPRSEPPLWQELGYAHCLAGAALVRDRTPGSIRVPAGAHGVFLPTLGTVRPVGLAPGSTWAELRVHGDGTASVHSRTTDTTLPADLRQPSPHWRPTPRLTWQPCGRPQQLLLEDASPYRDLRPGTPQLLTDELVVWQKLFDDASSILARRHPESGRMLALTLRGLAPLPAAPLFRTLSATYAEAFGYTLVSRPHRPADLAVTLVHEARHSLLNALTHQIRLVEPGPSPLLYAPWRSDPRPVQGVLHGVYAFTGVAEFWRVERHAGTGPEADLAHFEFAVWRQAVVQVLKDLRSAEQFSPWGRHFVDRLRRRAARWSGDSVPEPARSLADVEKADRWATWRIRHLRPTEQETADLCTRWADGAPARLSPGTARLRTTLRRQPPEPRNELRRRQLLGVPPEKWPCPGDMHLVRGAPARAADHYRTALARDPRTRTAWIGLGLALRQDGGRDAQAAADALLHRPELVRAVHLRIGAGRSASPDPAELASWLGRGI